MNISDSQNSDSHSEQPPGTPHSAQSNTPSSSLASTSTLLEDQDEDVRIAVRALGDMRSGNIGGAARDSVPLSQSTSSKTVSSSSPVLSSPSTSSNNAQLEPDFVSRMTHIPLVNGALRMYEQGKASSRVVKYGAEIMENSVKTISRPVIDRLPTGQLDDFACRQLDRLDKYRWPSQGSQVALESQRREEEERERMERMSRAQNQRMRDDYESVLSERNERGEEVGRWLGDMTSSNSLNNSRSSLSTSPRSPANSRDRDRYHDQSDLNPPSSSTAEAGPFDFRGSSSEYRSTSDDRWASRTHHTHRREREREDLQGQGRVVQRSGLQNLLLEAGSFSVAWSEESLTKLRYVLQRLQDATNHIDQQILAIREFTEALQQHYLEGSPSTPTTNAQDPSEHLSSSTSYTSFPTGAAHSRSSSESQAISPAHRHKLDAIRRDVIKTVRNVVSVVSKYGGNAAIPEPARTTVKAYIMQLPKKVGEAMRMTQMGALADGHLSNGHNGHPGMALAGPSGDVSGRDAAASGRAGRLSTTTARKAGRVDRGLGGSWSAAPSPMSSKTNSPTASPRSIPFRGLHPSASSVNGFHGEDDVIGSRTSGGHQMSAGTAVMAAKRILTLATESLDMMRGVTGVVQDSLERADAWIERLKTAGIRREDGPSNVQAAESAGSSRPISPSTASEYERERGWMNLTLDPVMMQRGRDADSTPLSPLSIGTTNLGRSRRSSVGSSTGFTYGDSLPSTPGLSGYPPAPYGANVSSYGRSYLDERPEVGLGIRRMNIHGEGEEEEVDIKKEEPEVKMEVDG